MPNIEKNVKEKIETLNEKLVHFLFALQGIIEKFNLKK